MAGLTDTQQLVIYLKTRGVNLSKRQLGQLNGTVKASKMGMVAMGGAILAATAALAAMAVTVAHAVKVGKEFEKNLQNLKAISGATKKEIIGLEKEALRLGRTTKFTASEVANLQTEYAKLGFKPDEIIEASEATLALAAATGTDLANAAAVAGSNVRAFGLDVKETGRVTDVMALSFSKSALDMQKFTDSMSYIAPVAKMAGFEIEGATAMVGTLANAGISGSMAGTALRRIFLELSNESSKLASRLGGPISSVEELTPALERLKEEGISTAEMKDLVGQRAMSAFSVLMEGTETTNELAEALGKAGGAAEKMANIQLDSLDGKLKILNSAWEGFGIALYERFETPLKHATEAMTEWIGELTEWTEVKTFEKLAKERASLNMLTGALKKNLKNEKVRAELIKQINDEFPEFLQGINNEALSIDKINEKLVEYNKNFGERIRLAVQEHRIAESADEISDAFDAQIYYARKLEEALYILNLATGVAIDDTKSYEENIAIQTAELDKNAFYTRDAAEKQEILAEANAKTGQSYDSLFRYQTNAKDVLGEVSTMLRRYNKSQQASSDLIQEQGEQYETLNKIMEELGLTLDDITDKDLKLDLELQTGSTEVKDEDLPYGGSAVSVPTELDLEGMDAGSTFVDIEHEQKMRARANLEKYLDEQKFQDSVKAFAEKRDKNFEKQAAILAFEQVAKGKITDITQGEVELIAEKLKAGEDELEILKEMFGIEETLEEKREAFREARKSFREAKKEEHLEDAEERILQLESMGMMEDATYAQVEAVAALLEKGKSLNEAMGEVFGLEVNPYITPENAQALFDELTEMQNEYTTMSFSIEDSKLAHEIELYDQRIEALSIYLDQQVALELMSSEDAAKKKAQIEEIYNKKKKQSTFQAFSAGISMMSSNLNAAAEAGIVSQKTAKKVAIVSTVIKTYESAVNAFNSMAGIPIIGPALGAVAAAAAVASGMAQVEAIKAQNEETPEKANVEKYIASGKAAAKAAEGGLIGGRSHAEGGTMIEAEKGEFIIKKSAVDRLGLNMLHQLNNTAKAQFPASSMRYQEGGLVDVGIDAEDTAAAPPVNISFSGNVLSRDFVEEEVIEVLQDYLRRGGEL